MSNWKSAVFPCLHKLFKIAYKIFNSPIVWGMVWWTSAVLHPIGLQKLRKPFRGELWTVVWRYLLGNPYTAKSGRRTATVFVTVVDLTILITSPHLEWASTKNRNILSMNGPAKSMCTCCQGLEGHTMGEEEQQLVLVWHLDKQCRDLANFSRSKSMGKWFHSRASWVVLVQIPDYTILKTFRNNDIHTP